MSDDYGKRLGKAFQAIYRLHRDTSKFFEACDGTVGEGKPSVFGSIVTKDLTRTSYDPDGWMPYGVYRYYDARADGPGLVDGLMVYFWDEPPKPDEPLLVLGRIKYRLEDGADLVGVCDAWDLWWAALEWQKNAPIRQVIPLEDVGEGRIEWMRLQLVPLFEVGSMEEARRLMGQVRGAGA